MMRARLSRVVVVRSTEELFGGGLDASPFDDATVVCSAPPPPGWPTPAPAWPWLPRLAARGLAALLDRVRRFCDRFAETLRRVLAPAPRRPALVREPRPRDHFFLGAASASAAAASTRAPFATK
jgi:hypothetical protein